MRYTFQRFTDEGKAILLINLAVTVLMAYVLSLWINLAISEKMSDAPVYRSEESATKVAPYRKTDYSIIKRRNIFNSEAHIPSATSSAPAIDPSGSLAETAPPTALNLNLIGTIITDSGYGSFAVIEDKSSRKQKLYALNDEPAPGARIVQIGRFAVLIDNSGHVESLTMEFKKDFPGSKKGKGREKGKSSKMVTMNSDVMKVGAGQVVMDKRYMDKQLADMNSLMTKVRVVPQKSDDGSMKGFKLFQINRGSIYDKIGLKNNDVIQRVNGQPLNSVESGLDLFYALKNEMSFSVDLERNNSKQTLTINIQ